MTRDNKTRLALFAGQPVHIERLALNYDQIEAYRPPPNPAKQTDSRFSGYYDKYGERSWELDALDPRRIRELIETAVERYRDEQTWNESIACQEASRMKIQQAADTLDEETRP